MRTRMLNRSAPILSRIKPHPFNYQLNAGFLSRETFAFYVGQDKLYLHDLAEAFRRTADRFSNERYKQQFIGFAKYIETVELKILEEYVGSSHAYSFFEPSNSTIKIPVIANYTEHLLNSAEKAPIEVAVASFLPCFLIFRELGKLMASSGRDLNHPYQKWIASYSGVRFSSATESIIATAQELHATISCPRQQEEVILSFLKSAEFELEFLNAAFYRHRVYKPAESGMCAIHSL